MTLKESIKEAVRTYKMFRYRDKIVSISMADLIRGNYESAVAVFKGFFGEPSWSDFDMMTVYKNTDGTFADARFKHAQSLVARFGWRLSAHTTSSGTGAKVLMVPGTALATYLTDKSVGVTTFNQKELYRSLM